MKLNLLHLNSDHQHPPILLSTAARVRSLRRELQLLAYRVFLTGPQLTIIDPIRILPLILSYMEMLDRPEPTNRFGGNRIIEGLHLLAAHILQAGSTFWLLLQTSYRREVWNIIRARLNL